MRVAVALTLVVACALVPAPAETDAPKPFDAWLADLRAEARQRGFADALLARTLDGLQPLDVVLDRDRNQPEAKLAFDAYLRRRVTTDTVRRAREALAAHRDVLKRIHDTYGVPPRLVVAIWGLESRFGRRRGDVPVFAALATLAWEGRRGAFFRAQLWDALRIVDRGHIDAASMVGSWAGAMGQPQFLPSSYLTFAVDFDHDGRRDIWDSADDALASIANYMVGHGWYGDDWGREVRASRAVLRAIADDAETHASGCRAMREMSDARSLSAWRRLGVTRPGGGALAAGERLARLVQAGRRQFLVYDTYEALLGYNCSHHYALSVALLAERIR
jgi:membrane-bound lytic murein transglycosylase B